jgi:hypothetical protein
MTDPITPPTGLVSKWCYEDGEEIKSSPRWFFSVCAKAARWGADQELEACCEWLVDGRDHEISAAYSRIVSANLRAARRPKPPSLKEQALEAAIRLGKKYPSYEGADIETIRRALEALPE